MQMSQSLVKLVTPRCSNRSPARVYKAPQYPLEFLGEVPSKVRMLKNVRSPFIPKDPSPTFLPKGAICSCWVSVKGDVVALLHSGRELYLNFGEYEVVEYHR